MVFSKKQQKVFQLILFRKNMGTCMPKSKLKCFWKEDFTKLKIEKNYKASKWEKRKVKIVKKNIKYLLFLDWVKFIGITGSVAAGISKKNDDIDVFIVVKNNRMWLYRAIMTLKLGRKSLRRVWNKPFKDKIDTNFICEERGILFNTESIFVLHELLFMIPVYDKEYYEKILNVNHELLKNYGIQRKEEEVNKKKNYILAFLDKIAFILQYTYMFLKNHKPNTKRIKKNNKKGRIAFFPENFRKEKVKEYERFSKKLLTFN